LRSAFADLSGEGRQSAQGGRFQESLRTRVNDEARTDAELERRIADLKARLPRHSVPPAMLQELESLEEELERLVQESEEDDETGRT
jgi:HAMP domain-containing protein